MPFVLSAVSRKPQAESPFAAELCGLDAGPAQIDADLLAQPITGWVATQRASVYIASSTERSWTSRTLGPCSDLHRLHCAQGRLRLCRVFMGVL